MASFAAPSSSSSRSKSSGSSRNNGGENGERGGSGSSSGGSSFPGDNSSSRGSGGEDVPPYSLGLQLDPIFGADSDDTSDVSPLNAALFGVSKGSMESFSPLNLGGVDYGETTRGGVNWGRKSMMPGAGGSTSEIMTSTWTNQDGNIKVGEKGVRLYHSSSREEENWEGQLNPDDLSVESEVLGRGACSVVNLATHNDTGEFFAVKVFNLLEREKRRQLEREIHTLIHTVQVGELSCRALVTFFGAFKRPDGKIRVILEYMDCGSVQDLVDLLVDASVANTGAAASEATQGITPNSSGAKGGADTQLQLGGGEQEKEGGVAGVVSEQCVAAICWQILQGLMYLHETNRLHRDIKPSNILLSRDGEVKLTDFGIARELDHMQALVETVVGTVRYMSPERLMGDAYSWPADMWGLGLVLLEMATGKMPLDESGSQIEILQSLKEGGVECMLPQGEARVGLSDGLLDVSRHLLQIDSKTRRNARQLLEHPWFAEQGIHGWDDSVKIVQEYMIAVYGDEDEEDMGSVAFEDDLNLNRSSVCSPGRRRSNLSGSAAFRQT